MTDLSFNQRKRLSSFNLNTIIRLRHSISKKHCSITYFHLKPKRDDLACDQKIGRKFYTLIKINKV